jgi:hypothetical protein
MSSEVDTETDLWLVGRSEICQLDDLVEQAMCRKNHFMIYGTGELLEIVDLWPFSQGKT